MEQIQLFAITQATGVDKSQVAFVSSEQYILVLFVWFDRINHVNVTVNHMLVI